MKINKIGALLLGASAIAASAGRVSAGSVTAVNGFANSYRYNSTAVSPNATSPLFEFGYYPSPQNYASDPDPFKVYDNKFALQGNLNEGGHPPAPLDFWNSSNAQVTNSYDPSVFYNPNPTYSNTLSTLTVPAGSLAFHPGMNTDSVIRFIAPAAGTYNFQATASMGDSNPTAVYLWEQPEGMSSAVTLASGVTGVTVNGVTTPTPFSFDGPATLLGGQYVDFLVNNNGGFYNETTIASLTVSTLTAGVLHSSPVPLPEAAGIGFSLLGGSAAFVSLRKRLFKSPRIA